MCSVVICLHIGIHFTRLFERAAAHKHLKTNIDPDCLAHRNTDPEAFRNPKPDKNA
jgi:hypothetical protein